MEAISSELNYFEAPVIQTAVQEEYDQEISPIATIQDGAPIEFMVKGVRDLYLDLNNTKLEVCLKICETNGTALVAGDRIGVDNLMLHSMFSNVDMEVGQKQVTDPNNLYPYRSIFETILNYPREVLDTRMICEGWTKDTAAQFDVTDPTGANTGLGTREQNYRASRAVRFIGRPHLDLFHQEKLLPGGVDMKLRFIPHKAPFVILNAAATAEVPQKNLKVSISSAKLYIRTKKVSPSLIMAHEQMLQTGTYKIPFTKVQMKTLTIPQGVTNFQYDNLYLGNLPDRIALALVHDEAVTGSYTRNPFKFDHYGLTHLGLKVGGEQIPKIPYQPDFTTRDYLREYMTVLSALGFDMGPNCWDITPTEWANGYNIYVFKITPGPLGIVKSLSRAGNIRLEIKFREATTHNITAILLSEDRDILEIDKNFHGI